MDETLTTKLAQWSCALMHGAPPASVAEETAIRILDTLGDRVAGARSAFGRQLLAAVPPAALAQNLAFAPQRAFVNASLASCLDFDDTHKTTLIHPTAPVLFAAIEAAAMTGSDGRALLRAVVAGTEIACRIAGAAPGAFHARGFHPSGVLGALGAAAAAALLFDPQPAAVANAIAIATSFGAGVMQPFIDGTDQRYLHAGNAASGGLLAARSAAAGISGSPQALEGRAGLFASHVPDAAPFDFAAVTAGLGERWESSDILLKRYPTGFVTHPYLDVALSLARDGLRPEEVAAITCVVPPEAVRLVCEPRTEKLKPPSPTMARVSLYHMLAEALVYRALDAGSFAPERLGDPAVASLARRIDYATAGGEAGPQRLILVRGGRSPEEIPVEMRAMDRREAVEKFAANVAGSLPEGELGRAAGSLLALEEMAAPLGEMAALLS